MKKIYMIALAALTTLSLATCANKDSAASQAVHNHEHHDHEGHDHDGHQAEPGAEESDEIILKPDIAQRLGVKVDTVALMPVNSVIKVAGQLVAATDDNAVCSSPTAGILTLAKGIEPGAHVTKGQTVATVNASGLSGGDANRVSKAELDAARTELERLKPLYESRLVTKEKYNAAVAAYERAKAGYSGAASAGIIRAAISGTITSLDAISGQVVETGSPVASISSSNRLTLRADVPARLHQAASQATDARIKLPYSDRVVTLSEIGGRRVSNAGATSMASYVPVVFTFDNTQGMVSGTPVEVYLLNQSDRQAAEVPVSAISEQQGSHYVYIRVDDEGYIKAKVETGESDGRYVEILSGLNGGEAVVTEGVTAVRLAESSGAVPAHSHSH